MFLRRFWIRRNSCSWSRLTGLMKASLCAACVLLYAHPTKSGKGQHIQTDIQTGKIGRCSDPVKFQMLHSCDSVCCDGFSTMSFPASNGPDSETLFSPLGCWSSRWFSPCALLAVNSWSWREIAETKTCQKVQLTRVDLCTKVLDVLINRKHCYQKLLIQNWNWWFHATVHFLLSIFRLCARQWISSWRHLLQTLQHSVHMETCRARVSGNSRISPGKIKRFGWVCWPKRLLKIWQVSCFCWSQIWEARKPKT